MSARLPDFLTAIRAVYAAFGAPGDYGYDTPKGAALNDLYRLWNEAAQPKPEVEATASLEDRLADCLADAIDTPLLELGDPECGRRKVQLRLGSFNSHIANRAAELLEEAGR